MPSHAQPRRPVTFVKDQEVFERLCDELCRERIIGLDVETTLRQQPVRLCTMQFATDRQNWVVDALSITDLNPVASLLESPSVLKVIHHAPFERRVFQTYGVGIENVLDTCVESRRIRGKQPDGHGLGSVSKRELELNLDKEMQKADWTCRPMTKRHLHYAALDAEVLIDLYEVFQVTSQ